MSNVGVAGVLRSRRGHEVHCRSRRLHHRHRHPALADPVYCSPSFQGYRVCSGPSGYASNEWSRDGMQFGQDSGGRRWMIWRWRGIETTTVTSLISKAERRMLSSILAAAEAGPSSLISI